MRIKDHLKVGKRQARPETGSHIRGVPEGAATGSLESEAGIEPHGRTARGTARRSTGICPKQRDPIDPASPNLSAP